MRQAANCLVHQQADGMAAMRPDQIGKKIAPKFLKSGNPAIGLLKGDIKTARRYSTGSPLVGQVPVRQLYSYMYQL